MLNNPETSLTWTNLTVRMKEKVILDRCSGYCEPGQSLAIMGPSGSGKTTLLSLLSKKSDSRFTQSGQVLANNAPFDAEQFNNFGAYVYQNDLLFETLTVKQTLTFVAKLKYKNSDVAQARVQQLIKIFELKKCQDVFVGGKIKKGISGGEKKRVNIAVEMVGKPSLLILDQPTSGLDSYKARRILRIFQNLAAERTTIIFTIHQPSHLLYTMLNRVLLLDRGQVVYQGKGDQMVPYLQSLQLTVPKNTTISDFFMFEIAGFKKGYQTTLNPQNYTLRLAPSVDKSIQQILSNAQDGYTLAKPAVSLCTMIRYLFKRQFTVYKRNPMKFGGMIINSVIAIVIVGTIFLNTIPTENQIAILTAFGFPPGFILIGAQGTCFINITNVIMTGIFSVALAFPIERDIYSKQVSSNCYTPFAYFLPKIIVQVASVCTGTLLVCSAVYWINGFSPTFAQFALFVVTQCSMSLVGNSLGLFTGTIFQDAQKASSLSPLILLPLMMFSGMYNRLNSIQNWIGWLQYISPFRYGLHMLLLNQYEDMLLLLPNGNIYNYKTDLGIDLSYIQNLAVVLGLSVMFYTLSYVFLRKLTAKITA